MDKVRIDKWLWAIRIFKSRSLSSDTVKSGKVRINQKVVKPSTTVQVGDRVHVLKNGFNLEFEVLQVIAKRVGAPLAQACYTDHTSAEELNKYQKWFVGKGGTEFREKGTGRPTKRERRDIDVFKGESMYDDEFFNIADEDETT